MHTYRTLTQRYSHIRTHKHTTPKDPHTHTHTHTYTHRLTHIYAYTDTTTHAHKLNTYNSIPSKHGSLWQSKREEKKK